MPTGYTAPLYEGHDITFEQFVLRCSRAMGAAIMQRDDSLDVEIEYRSVDDYYFENVTKADDALREAFQITDELWAQRQDEAIAEAEKHRADYIAKRAAMTRRYESMLAQVRAWEPPTPQHSGLHRFMIEQLEESIRFDCGDYTPNVPEHLPVAEYRAQEIARRSERLSREHKYLAEEQKRVSEQNAWVRALRDSLNVPI